MAVSFGTVLDHFLSEKSPFPNSASFPFWVHLSMGFSHMALPDSTPYVHPPDPRSDPCTKMQRWMKNSCAINSPFALMSGTNCRCHPCRYFRFHIGRKSCTKEINVTGRQGNINRGRRPINQPRSDSEGIRPLLWVQSVLPACPLTPR